MEQCLTNDLLGKCAIGARVSFFPCCIMYCYSNQLPKWLSFCLIVQNCTLPSCTMYFSFFGGGMLKHNLGSVCLHTGQVVDPCTLITHEIVKEDILALGVQMNPCNVLVYRKQIPVHFFPFASCAMSHITSHSERDTARSQTPHLWEKTQGVVVDHQNQLE